MTWINELDVSTLMTVSTTNKDEYNELRG